MRRVGRARPPLVGIGTFIGVILLTWFVVTHQPSSFDSRYVKVSWEWEGAVYVENCSERVTMENVKVGIIRYPRGKPLFYETLGDVSIKPRRRAFYYSSEFKASDDPSRVTVGVTVTVSADVAGKEWKDYYQFR